MIHFTNGDIVADALTASGVPGRAVTCADPLHDGPCLPGLSRAEWRDSRAHFLSSSHSVPLDEVRDDLELRDAAIDDSARAEEVVLWFEHDLFDQLNLIWLLDALAEAGTPAQRVRLLVIGEHPEVDPFHGLGQLSPAQLLALFPSRETLSSEALAEARAAWADVCAPDPRPLAQRAMSASRHWPWLPGALRRLVEELPSVSAGLSRTERQGLEAIGRGAETLGEAFSACAVREERVFLGDWTFYAIMRRLHLAATPLITRTIASDEPADSVRSSVVALTAFGERVVSWLEDHASVNGLDRWVGGVHLLGPSPRFRVATEGGALQLV
jgi:hypothetical protein